MGDGREHPRVLAAEWLAAAQGLDMREGLTTSPLLEEARHLLLRTRAALYAGSLLRPVISITPLRFWRPVT
ncbi:hypothetical protein LNO88_08020 [Klebsiella pneumoniae subsp. pneumoniae]|nr:hypothetical protein [Klebsiella pneumoniae subsp. pneumoniae]